CGSGAGCQWQHVAYAEQLAAKQAIVERALGPGAPVDPILASPRPYEYRWRARQHVEGGAVGYHRWRSRAVLDVRRCLLLPLALDQPIQAARPELPARGA